MRHHLFTFAWGLLVAVTALGAAGCNIESMWNVPCSAGERPSILWATDPRTQGWNNVEVEYWLLSNGAVDATARSSDRRHQFKERGSYWYENGRGETAKSPKDLSFLVVEFGGREERYRFVYNPVMDRPCIVVEPTLTSSFSEPLRGLANPEETP